MSHSGSAAPGAREIFSVGALNRRARTLLESQFGLIWVTGELSNFSCPSSGHWYFSLKDSDAQVRCAMFRNKSQYQQFRPKDGQQVLVRARVSLYEPRGDYQLIAEYMEEAGLGALQRAFEQLKTRLSAEGLFASERKKPLPAYPRRVGVATSATGAALHDILTVLRRRMPSLPVIIYPTAVQGAEAAAQIVQALETANRRNECDVLILGRGGGSLEDLWCFNDERVARAIAASRLPVVSAVGHEVDITIADFVADWRAPTPSAAAEAVSPDRQEEQGHVRHLTQRLSQRMQESLRNRNHRLQHLEKRLPHPLRQLERRSQRLDELELRLRASIRLRLAGSANRLQRADSRLRSQNPSQQLQRRQQRLDHLQARLRERVQHLLAHQGQRLATAAASLNILSPLTTLARGYSITLTPDRARALRSIHDTAVGAHLETRLGDGRILSQVLSLAPDPE